MNRIITMTEKLIRNPVQLYRHLLRRIRLLPDNSKPYYKNYVRQGFNSHKDESDPERVQQIINRAIEDAEWIVKKYTQKAS